METKTITDYKETIHALHETLNQIEVENEKYTKKNALCIWFLDALNKQAHIKDYEKCTYCIANELPKITTSITKCVDENIIDQVFSITVRFVKERIMKAHEGFYKEEKEILNFYYTNTLNEFEAYDKLLLENKFIPHVVLNIFPIIDNKIEIVTSKIFDYHKLLQEWEIKIQTYREELKKNYSQYNFVNLSRAFSDLLDSKNNELTQQKIITVALATITIALPIIILAYNLVNITSFSEKINLYFPTLALEILLIYYFRINLQLFFNIKAQILQLELRRSLCAFAEGYTTYKKDNADHLSDKFETLIFSPILQNPDKIPSTFDGFDQLIKLIKECKAK